MPEQRLIVIGETEFQSLLETTVANAVRLELSKRPAKITDYMTLEETAVMLKSHPATVMRAVDAGEIIAHPFGRKKVFDKNDLFTEKGLIKYTKYNRKKALPG